MARAQDNPILNSPYEEPGKHYATDTQGNLNYQDVRPGRRIFAPDVPRAPLGQQKQGKFERISGLAVEDGTQGAAP